MSVISELRELLERDAEREARPHGQEASRELKRLVGEAAVQLCRGDKDRARTMYKLIMRDCGGYFPHAAAVALMRATSPNLVPDVPDPMDAQ